MSRSDKQHGSHSLSYQQSMRAEIARQVEAFLRRGGQIETLSSPRCLPHNEVRVGAAASLRDSL